MTMRTRLLRALARGPMQYWQIRNLHCVPSIRDVKRRGEVVVIDGEYVITAAGRQTIQQRQEPHA